MRRYSNRFGYTVTTAIFWFIVRAVAVVCSHCVRYFSLAWKLMVDLVTTNRPLVAYICRTISPVNSPAVCIEKVIQGAYLNI